MSNSHAIQNHFKKENQQTQQNDKQSVRLQAFREADVHIGASTYHPSMRGFIIGRGYSSSFHSLSDHLVDMNGNNGMLTETTSNPDDDATEWLSAIEEILDEEDERNQWTDEEIGKDRKNFFTNLRGKLKWRQSNAPYFNQSKQKKTKKTKKEVTQVLRDVIDRFKDITCLKMIMTYFREDLPVPGYSHYDYQRLEASIQRMKRFAHLYSSNSSQLFGPESVPVPTVMFRMNGHSLMLTVSESTDRALVREESVSSSQMNKPESIPAVMFRMNGHSLMLTVSESTDRSLVREENVCSSQMDEPESIPAVMFRINDHSAMLTVSESTKTAKANDCSSQMSGSESIPVVMLLIDDQSVMLTVTESMQKTTEPLLAKKTEDPIVLAKRVLALEQILVEREERFWDLFHDLFGVGSLKPEFNSEDDVDRDENEIETRTSQEYRTGRSRVNGMASNFDPSMVWRIDPRSSIIHWKKLRRFVKECIASPEPVPILIVAGDRNTSSLAKSIRGSFLKKKHKGIVTLISTNWIYGRLTNFDQLREMAMKYQVTPAYELKPADHHRYSIYLRPLEPRRIRGKRPGLVIFLNAGEHLVAVRETAHMGIPCAGVVNTDFSMPERIDYLLPGNPNQLSAQFRYLSRRKNQLEESFDRLSSASKDENIANDNEKEKNTKGVQQELQNQDS